MLILKQVDELIDKKSNMYVYYLCTKIEALHKSNRPTQVDEYLNEINIVIEHLIQEGLTEPDRILTQRRIDNVTSLLYKDQSFEQ